MQQHNDPPVQAELEPLRSRDPQGVHSAYALIAYYLGGCPNLEKIKVQYPRNDDSPIKVEDWFNACVICQIHENKTDMTYPYGLRCLVYDILARGWFDEPQELENKFIEESQFPVIPRVVRIFNELGGQTFVVQVFYQIGISGLE